MPEVGTRSEPLGREPLRGLELAEGMRVAWAHFWASRILVWVAGIAALAIFGSPDGAIHRLDPLALTLPFESDTLNALLAPAARWDAVHYVQIATFGYYGDPSAPAFFPLFPLLMAIAGGKTASLVLGVGLSIVFSLAGMLLLYRLVELDFGRSAATATVAIVAFYPGSLVLSAAYTDALFLALSVGAVLGARRGRWATAGMLGALSAATRSGGVLLVIPLLAIYVLGPRSDRPPAAPGRLGVRYPLRPDAAWIALVPVGLLAYMAYLASTLGDPLALFSAQAGWSRVFVPMGGVVLAVWSAIQGLVQFLPGVGPDSVLAPQDQFPVGVGLRNVALLAFLGFAFWLLRECGRRLPAAYTLYAGAALALPLSVPALDEPLKSLPRFMLVVFPLWIALALWSLERGRLRHVLGAFALLLIAFSALFTTWVQAP